MSLYLPLDRALQQLDLDLSIYLPATAIFNAFRIQCSWRKNVAEIIFGSRLAPPMVNRRPRIHVDPKSTKWMRERISNDLCKGRTASYPEGNHFDVDGNRTGWTIASARTRWYLDLSEPTARRRSADGFVWTTTQRAGLVRPRFTYLRGAMRHAPFQFCMNRAPVWYGRRGCNV